MSRDFAKRDATRHTKAPQTKKIPAWLWFILGAILGAFGMALVFLWSNAQANKTTTTTIEKPTAADNRIPKPRFDFYKLLQDSEVIVPATESATDATHNNANTAAPMEYILQVGSFPNRADAEKLRTELKELHLETHIETVEIHKGELWHRVIVGPFDAQDKLATARSSLVANQYTALVLKRAKSGK